MPTIDLLELWSEAFEMKQEKSALYGEPHSQSNPYYPPHHSVFDGDQAESYSQQSLHERPPLGLPELRSTPHGQSLVAPVSSDD